MFEELIVYAAVVCAAAYATWRLLPGEVGRTLAKRFGFVQAHAQMPGQRGGSRASSGCGSCTGCAAKNPSATVTIIKDRRDRLHGHAK